jgi:hypothetical protein
MSADPGIRRAALFALLFWALVGGFVLLDWARSAPHNRFDEPPPWALGQPAGATAAGHCAAPLK